MRALCSGPNWQALSHLHKWKRNKTSYERKFISSKLERHKHIRPKCVHWLYITAARRPMKVLSTTCLRG